MNYAVGITLEVEAETGQLAIAAARAAGKSLQGVEGVAHATMDTEAMPLFDDRAFRQLRGQMPLAGETFDQWHHRKHSDAHS